MRIKLIETGEITEVADLWGERLIEQGKAVVLLPETKATVTVTDKVPEEAEEAGAEEPKAETKKAGKKR